MTINTTSEKHGASVGRKPKTAALPLSETSDTNQPTPTLRGKALGQRMADLKAPLDAACAAIDARPEFAGNPEANAEARVLRKVGEYRSWLVENHLPPHAYLSRPFARRILEFIGHPRFEITAAVTAEIQSLSDLLPAGGAATAPVRPDRIDDLADKYAAKMRDRKFGLPRNHFHKVHWRAAAEEMGCSVDEISTSVKGRLRAIDRAIGIPGPMADRPILAGNRAAANPAVGPLIAAELERRAGRMPADPMQPGEIDIIDIAFHAGVSMRDLTEAPDANEHLAAIQAARGDEKLVPHPGIAARRFNYRELTEFGRKLRKVEAKAAGIADPDHAARMTVRALTRFLSIPRLGGRKSDKVPLDLPARIKRAIAAKPTGFESGWVTQIERWIRYFNAIRSALPLPENWTTALRILAAEVKVGRNEIVAAAGPAAQSWLKGLSFPTHQSQPAVAELEKTLRVDAGTLSKRLAPEWRAQRPEVGIAKLGRGGVGRVLPASIVGQSPEKQREVIEQHWEDFRLQGTEFSLRLTEQIKSRYRLKFEKWPAVMQAAWESQTPDEAKDNIRKEITGRVPGQRPGKAERASNRRDAERGWRGPTAKISKGLLEALFGYFGRSTTPPAPSANDNGFIDGPGLGMPTELIHPVLFAVVDLLAGYKYFRRDRSGGHFGPHIAYTMWQAADYLKPETGIVWKNPEFLEHLERFAEWWDESGAKLGLGTLVLDLDAFREDWHAAVEEAWEILRADATEIRPLDPERPKIRDPFIVLDGYLADPKSDPMAKYMIPLRQMLASRPMTAHDRHLHRRNSILALILIQTALRATTMLLTVSGPDPTLRREVDEEGVVSWRITIPASRFKNFYSPYFAKGAPYEFTLDDEDDLYALLDEYMATSRRYLLAGRKSDALFITSGGRDCKATDLSNIYRNLTAVFFVWNASTKTGIKGVRRHGLHAVRHIVATSLLRTTGDIYLAAWAIQDTARTVERHYGRFLPRDKVRLAVEHLRKSRAPKPVHAAVKGRRLPLAA